MVVDSEYIIIGPFGVNRRCVIEGTTLGYVNTQVVAVPCILGYPDGFRECFLVSWYVGLAVTLERELAFVP